MKTSICFQCKCQALCPTGQVQSREATVSAITGCSRFQSKDKLTRADRIWAMTDEELAKLLTEAECPSDFGGEEKCKDPPPHTSLDSILCRECWLDWLRQEATQ